MQGKGSFDSMKCWITADSKKRSETADSSKLDVEKWLRSVEESLEGRLDQENSNKQNSVKKRVNESG